MDTISAMLEDMRTMPNRCEIPHVLNKYGLTGHAAEIGVDMAHYASAVLTHWKGQRYYAVDLWAKQDPSVYPEQQFDHNLSFKRASDFARREPRFQMIRQHSVVAANQVPDASLDWVWIDANHEYEPVLADMTAWWPKVKPGGVFSGHDYPLPTVLAAVNRWFYLRRKELAHVPDFVTSDSSWWSVKP